MGNWRDRILREFTPKVFRLTVVADPDGLLLEEHVIQGLRERGFELIQYEDPIGFRYAYESRFRSRWDLGEDWDVVVIARLNANHFDRLPYDLLQAGRRLSFSLGDIFPNLSLPVVAALDRADLDALYEAHQRFAHDRLGEDATKDFILRYVFGIALEHVRQPADLLRVLLTHHYRAQRIPGILGERFIQVLRQDTNLRDWPLEILVPDREAFFRFLQERWPIFLDQQAAQENLGVRVPAMPYGLSIAGPEHLPFEDDHVRVFIDNLFIEGFLKPVPHEHALALSDPWLRIGICTEDGTPRLQKLLDNLSQKIPNPDARYDEWLHFAHTWAEMMVISHENGKLNEQHRALIEELTRQLDERFASWIRRRFASLYQASPTSPVMVHQIPRYLANLYDDHASAQAPAKIALVVIDGLSLDQWLVIREVLEATEPLLRFKENTVFAWIPTLTSVSRQAIFAGEIPFHFRESIHTTDKEGNLWKRFWENRGLEPSNIGYMKGLGDGDLASLSDLLSDRRLRVAGLVVDKVDRIMHGMELGTAGMHNQVRQWAKQGYLQRMMDRLFELGFLVFVTSDHGNIEATGWGRPSEGALADQRGERVRVYSDQALRGRAKGRFPAALEWETETVGLPKDYLALLAPGRQAFIGENERVVCHGGISLEEIIVPFVQIEKRGKRSGVTEG